jgi:hypothetical protein
MAEHAGNTKFQTIGYAFNQRVKKNLPSIDQFVGTLSLLNSV